MNKITVSQELMRTANSAIKSSSHSLADYSNDSECLIQLGETSNCAEPTAKMKTCVFEENTNSVKGINSNKVHTNHVTFQRTYKVVYLGYAVLDRRYTLPMLPWVIAEIKHYGSQNAEDIYLEVTESSLKAANIKSSKLVFEHKLQTISKFAQTAQDPTCFTYMTREITNGPCAYHVFQAFDECLVFELFNTLREMTKEMVLHQSALSPLSSKCGSAMELNTIMSAGQHYEVLYLGRIKVCSKRAPPTFIDDAVERFHANEMEKFRNQQDSRQRHGSGASVCSLPYTLDLIECPKENELGLQVKSSSQGSKEHLNGFSKDSSAENISRNSLEVINRTIHKSCSDPFHISPARSTSFSENFITGISPSISNTSFSQSEDTVSSPISPAKMNLMPPVSLITHTQSLDTATTSTVVQDLQTIQTEFDTILYPSKQTSLPAYRTRVGSGGSSDIRRPRAFTNPAVINNSQQKNRTMLFLIGRQEICLIGTDRKIALFSKTFNDIAHCSQGTKYIDHFGFICREIAAAGADFYAGYIFRCQTERVVDDIMQSLKMAFNKAHQDYQHSPQPKANNVPRVVICDACPMQWFHRLCSDVEGLPPEKTHCNILLKLHTLPDGDREEIMQKCENADVNCLQEQNEVLMMLLRKFCERKQLKHNHLNSGNSSKNDMIFVKDKTGSSKLDTFRQKAKKSLSSSFETIMKLKHREDSRERSFTSISDNAIGKTLAVLRDEDLEDSHSHREGSYDGPTTSSNKTSDIRPRSSTFSTTHEVRKASKKKQVVDKSKNASPQSKSPIMNIFMKVGHQNSTPPVSGDECESPTKKGSWRQAIFHRVQTPVATSKPSSGSVHAQHSITHSSCSSDEELKPVVKKSREQLRALWKKAILEQILLIRMEKENKKLQVSQDAVTHKRMKLDYEDITPCLKESVIQWDQLLVRNSESTSSTKIDKEKLLELIKAGVPRNRRGEIWQFLAEQHNMKNVSYVKNGDFELSMPYEELLRQLTSHQHSILIDLGRTFPNHPFYSQPLGSGQLALFNLLKAYSLLDKEVGYCQGLSFVAGILLLHMPEEKAFVMMKHILFHLGLRRQYKPDMVALQIEMYQLSRLMHDNYREVYDHLERYDIAPTLYAAPWFLTLFASQFPLGFVSRLFDVILLQGQEVIFKIALVLMGNHRDAILQCHGFEAIMEFVKCTLPAMNIIEVQRVFNQVFTLDISKQLHAYEVEYHVLKEEMMYSPSRGDAELLQKLETANRSLKVQNMELTEQLQVAYSRIHNLEASESSYRSTITRLESRVVALEEEKEVLLHSLGMMRKRLQKLEVASLDEREVDKIDGHPPSFQVVYKLAGSEKDEDRQLKQLIQNFREERDTHGGNCDADNDWVMIKEEDSGHLSAKDDRSKYITNTLDFPNVLNCDTSASSQQRRP